MWIDKERLEKELIFKTSRSSGAGGQHVNKVESKVSLFWDFNNSLLFSQVEKDLIFKKLSNRCNSNSILQLDVSETRSQHENKIRAIDKLVYLLKEALTPDKKRIKTKIPRSKVLKRLEGKRILSEKKAIRKWKPNGDS